VLIEKAAPRGELIARISGGMLIAASLWMFYQSL
jgi:predicted metal-binding membrane protein